MVSRDILSNGSAIGMKLPLSPGKAFSEMFLNCLRSLRRAAAHITKTKEEEKEKRKKRRETKKK
jgi:hypothetical protein